MASWEPNFVVQRRESDRIGRQRRREAWLGLGLLCSVYVTVWAWKGFFG